MKKVGILGGMGPEATILLQQRLLKAVPATRDTDHIPLLIDMNPQVPSRIERLIHRTGPDPAPVLATMAQRLERAGASALAMPCNTAHHYAEEIKAAVSIPFLDMVALSVNMVVSASKTNQVIGLLASPAVRKTGLFDPLLIAADRIPLWPALDDKILKTIELIKAKGSCEHARANFSSASQDLFDQGAELQLIACSEFSLIAEHACRDCTTIDTLNVLIEAIRNFSQPFGRAYNLEKY